MPHKSIGRLAFVGNYVPRNCGLATFTSDLRNAVYAQARSTECIVVPVSDGTENEYPPEVRFVFREQDLESYKRAADFLNLSGAEVVSLQHEYGIYGGEAGNYILSFLRHLDKPVVTTMHTVLDKPTPEQLRVTREIADRSSLIVVMANRGRQFLREIYGVPDAKIRMIPHGIPDMPFVDPNFYKDTKGVAGRPALLTFGLLSPNKGIETVLRALPAVVQEVPDVHYTILGVTHPNLLRTEGERYRQSLEHLTEELNIKNNVSFHNRFVELGELLEYIGSADIYITPYRDKHQITSGTLAYAFGCGKAVVSTPYWHAEELLAGECGVLFPFDDHEQLAKDICRLLANEEDRHAMRKRAYMIGREMVWSNVAQQYLHAFHPPRRTRRSNKRHQLQLDESPLQLPRIRLPHLLTMTDSTGLLQHAEFSFPLYSEGYCTDDNARALLLAVLLEELDMASPELDRAVSRYAAFLHYAFNEQRHAFRNFMLFNRRWRHEVGSDDSQGRALLALGSVVGRSGNAKLRLWAQELFVKTLPTVTGCDSPRTWAYALIGIHEYFRRLNGDCRAEEARLFLTDQLIRLYEQNASNEWRWFEDVLAYGNAVMPHALILSGRWCCNQHALDIGLSSLEWLQENQRGDNGCFRPIGNQGFYHRGGERAIFDQQPIEAYVTCCACIEAHGATGDQKWLDEAYRAFSWFLGRNDLGVELVNRETGACGDGLHPDRVNQNDGAESTLAYLLSLARLHLVQQRTRRESAQHNHKPISTESSHFVEVHPVEVTE